MTGESGSKTHLRIARVHIDNEVFVRRHRIHASRRMRYLTVERGNSKPDRGPDCQFITRMDPSINGGRCTRFIATMNPDLWVPIYADSRKAIEQGGSLRLPQKDREHSAIKA